MNFYAHIDLLILTNDPFEKNAIASIDTLKRGKVGLGFFIVRGGIQRTLASTAEVKFVLKPLDQFDASPVAELNITTQPSTVDDPYVGTLNTDTPEVRALMFVDGNPTNDLKVLPLMGELLWRDSSADDWQRIQTVPVNLANAVYSTDDPAVSSVPLRNLVFSPTIVGLTGGGSTKLDGTITAAGLPVNTLATFDLGNGLEAWRLDSSTHAEDVANGYVRPDDYNGTTNQRVWRKVLPGAAGSNQQLQYNNGGLLAGLAGSTWDGTTLTFPSISVDGDLVGDLNFRGGTIQGTANVDIIGNITATGNLIINNDAEIVGNLVLDSSFAAFGAPPPGSQPATPTTLGDVITILQAFGLCA